MALALGAGALFLLASRGLQPRPSQPPVAAVPPQPPPHREPPSAPPQPPQLQVQAAVPALEATPQPEPGAQPPDAGPPPQQEAPSPPQPAAATPPVPAAPPSPQVRVSQFALVEFRVVPFATVRINDTDYGETPLPPIKLPVGKVNVVLENEDLGKTVTVPFTVVPGANVFSYTFR